MTTNEPWKVVTEKVTHTARILVSRDKYRLKDNELGVDLDLTYITNNIIAMGVPSRKFDSLYRNHENDVAKYLNTRHNNHYMIFNLSEKSYTYSKFGNSVRDFGWPDHHAPPLSILCNLVQNMADWLSLHPENVVVVHCKAGRGRTGTAIGCLLYYIKICPTISNALWFFAERRSKNGEGVEGPSQIRYCNYFQYSSINGIPLSRKIILAAIEFKPIPSISLDGKFAPCFELCSPMTPKKPFYSNLGNDSMKYSTCDYSAKIFCNCELDGDILIRVSDQSKVKIFSLLFRIQFHTSFIQTPICTFYYADLDNTTAGPLRDNRFPSNFSCTLFFEDNSSPFDNIKLKNHSPILRTKKQQNSVKIRPLSLNLNQTLNSSVQYTLNDNNKINSSLIKNIPKQKQEENIFNNTNHKKPLISQSPNFIQQHNIYCPNPPIIEQQNQNIYTPTPPPSIPKKELNSPPPIPEKDLSFNERMKNLLKPI